MGRVTSLTVTVKEQVLERPAPSVARYVMVVIPTGKVDPEARPPINVMEGAEQLSVAEIEPYVTTALQAVAGLLLAVTLAGQVMLGA